MQAVWSVARAASGPVELRGQRGQRVVSANYWIKLYHEILRDPKMGRLPDRAWRRTIEIFLLAGETGQDGRLPDTPDIAWQLRVDEDELLEDMRLLAEQGILTQTDDGWLVTHFEDRQRARTSTERSRRHREQQRRDEYWCNDSLQERNDDATNRPTESDTDKESDTDSEPEAEPDAALSSFVGESFRSFENTVGMVASQHQAEEIAEFLAELHERGHPEWWQMALDVSCDNNARKWSYMRAVLRNWLDVGSPNISGNRARASPQEDEYDETAALQKAKRYGLE